MKLTITKSPFSYISGSAVSKTVVFNDSQNSTHVSNFVQV